MNVKKHKILLFKKLEQGTVCCFDDQNNLAVDLLSTCGIYSLEHKLNKSLVSYNILICWPW